MGFSFGKLGVGSSCYSFIGIFLYFVRQIRAVNRIGVGAEGVLENDRIMARAMYSKTFFRRITNVTEQANKTKT